MGKPYKKIDNETWGLVNPTVIRHEYMRYFTLLIVIYCFSGQVVAYEYDIESWQLDNGPKCGLIFNGTIEKQIKIKWDGVGQPPITVSEAQSIFEKWEKHKYGDKITSEIVKYELVSFRGKAMKSNHWLYVISFLKFPIGSTSPDFNEKVAIFMNGRVLESQCK